MPVETYIPPHTNTHKCTPTPCPSPQQTYIPTHSSTLSFQGGSITALSQQGNRHSFLPKAPSSIQSTLRTLFQPYNAAGQSGRMHRHMQVFCCVHEPLCTLAPSQAKKEMLTLAGLGHRRLELKSVTGTFEEFRDQLFEAYPLLINAGGFKLMRGGRSQTLEDIPMPVYGYTIPFLKTLSLLRKAIAYIIPLQKALPLNCGSLPVMADMNVIKEVCQSCSASVPLFELQKHIQQCGRASLHEESIIHMSSLHEESIIQSSPRGSSSWPLRVVLIQDPFMEKFNPNDAEKMRTVMVSLSLNTQQFEEVLRKEFPFLGSSPFELCRLGKNRLLHPLSCPIKTPSAIRASGELGRSALYIRPQENYSDGGSPTPAVIRSAHPSPCHQGTPSVVIEVSHAWPLPPVSPPSMNPACPPCQQTTATPNISPACSPCWRYTPPPNSPACPPCQAATPASSPHSASSDITWSPPNETFEEIILDETSFVGVNEADLEDSPDRFESLVKALQNRLPELPPPRSNTINVVRDDVFNCAERAFKRQRFNPEAPHLGQWRGL
ncbi:uncharacterized protein LOC125294181 isoform X2 [Alosa alosa]|uniref:uncharacterized protein LOC125294181 isoform X2 n=1 Tax=Alosa alosa TaxID=278164 RepID=UPI0020153489|nr:uncharacterized protein LOC125294181 isoform X2 [Alosa alosa]